MFLTYAAGVFAILVWSLTPVLAKVALVQLPISYMLVIRFLVSSVLSAILWPSSLKKIPRLKLGEIATLSLTLAVNFVFGCYAVSRMPASSYVVLFSLNPIVSLYVMGLHPSARAKFGIALAALGTLAFVASGDAGASAQPLALAALMGAMLTWAYYSKQLKTMHDRFGDGELSALTSVFGTPAMLLIWVASGLPRGGFSGDAATAVIAMGALVPLAYWTFSTALRRAPVFGITCQYLEPVFGVLIARAYLSERMNAAQVVGSCLALIGTALTARRVHTLPARSTHEEN